MSGWRRELSGSPLKPKAISDWRNPECYPRGPRVSLKQWAWEFLRRNTDYHADWLRYAEVCQQILPDWLADRELPDSYDDVLREDSRFKVFDPPLYAAENESEWIDRVGKGRILSLDSWLGKKYGLRYIVNPFADYRGAIYGGLDFTGAPRLCLVSSNWEGFNKAATISENQYRAIGIDLSLPIEAQLRYAQRMLEAAQKRLILTGVIEQWPDRKNRSREWTDLLRILDAAACAASPAEMAAEFFPHSDNEYPSYAGQKAVDKRLKAAKSLAQEGYRYLPMIR